MFRALPKFGQIHGSNDSTRLMGDSMILFLAVVVTFFLVGFGAGYGTRAGISYRRRIQNLH
jgi:hypothetical protein